MERLLFLIVIGIVFNCGLVLGKSCPELTRPHLTRCDMYFKCTLLASKTHVWVPTKCEQGLIYEHTLRMCVVAGEDWECNLDSDTSSIRLDDDNNVYGVNNLQYLTSQLSAYHLTNIKNQQLADISNIKTDTVASTSEKIPEEYDLVVGGDEPPSVTEITQLVGVDELTQLTSAAPIIDIGGTTDGANNPEVSEIEVEYSGDGEEKTNSEQSAFPQEKTDLIAIPMTSKIDSKLTHQLQRLTQLIDSLKESQQKNNGHFEILPDQLNSFLAEHNIKSNYQPINFDGSDKMTMTDDGKIHPEQMTEIITQQNKLNAVTMPMMMSTTPKNPDVMLNPTMSTTKLTRIHIKSSPHASGNGDHTNKDGSFSTSQIVVNKPEGAVLFNLPNDDKPDKREPYISEETLRTVLELSKQMVASSHQDKSSASSAAVPQNNYLQPIVRPVYYTVPIHDIPIPMLSSDYYKNGNNNDNYNRGQRPSNSNAYDSYSNGNSHQNNNNKDNNGHNNEGQQDNSYGNRNHDQNSQHSSHNDDNRYNSDSSDESNYHQISSVKGYSDTAGFDNKKKQDPHSTVIVTTNVLPAPPSQQQQSDEYQKNPNNERPHRSSISITSSQPPLLDSYGSSYNTNSDTNQNSYNPQVDYIQYPPPHSNQPLYSSSYQSAQLNSNYQNPYQYSPSQQYYPQNPEPYQEMHPPTVSYYTPSPHLTNTNVNQMVSLNNNNPYYPTNENLIDYNQQQPALQQPAGVAYQTQIAPPNNQHRTDPYPYAAVQLESYDTDNDRQNAINGDAPLTVNAETVSSSSNKRITPAEGVNETNVPDQLASAADRSTTRVESDDYDYDGSVSDNKNKLVQFGGSFIDYQTYKSDILPLLQADTLTNGGVEVLSCVRGVREANITDCTRYYMCNPKDHKVIKYTCPDFTAFNQPTKTCDAATYAKCKAIPTKRHYSVDENKKLHLEAQHAYQEAEDVRLQLLRTQQINQMLKTQSHNMQQQLLQQQQNPPRRILRLPVSVGNQRLQQQQPTPFRYRVDITAPTLAPVKPRKRRRLICRSVGKFADPQSPKNYFLCGRTQLGKLRGHLMACAKELVFCAKMNLCTLATKC